jgi:ATP-dependent DNA ligase
MALFLPPMRARSANAPFDSDAHLFEVKWDGYRAILSTEGGKAQLWSRSGRSLLPDFPSLAALAAEVRSEAVLDGELVALGEDGRPDFSRLRRRLPPLCYIAFDLLREGGRDLCPRPLAERRARLEELVCPQGALALSAALPREGVALFREVEARGLEGVMAKRLDSPYLPGVRSDAWLKIPCWRRGLFLALSLRPGQGGAVLVELAQEEGGKLLPRGALPVPSPALAEALSAQLARGAPARLVVRYRQLLPSGRLRHGVVEALSP